MSRVSTHGNYQSALLDLMASQQRSHDAQKRIGTQKNATDLIGFGREAATVSALKSTQSKIDGYIQVNQTVADRLDSQDMALGRISEAATAARLAIANAIANGRMDGMMVEMGIQFQISVDALNSKHQDQYLFSGGDQMTAPVAFSKLDEFSPANTDLGFRNGSLRQASRLDDNVVMDTSFRADDVGNELFAIFRDLQNLHATTPLEGKVEGGVDAALTSLMQRFDAAASKLVDKQATNGVHQNRVEKLLTDHKVRADSVEIMLADKTDADMAKAVTDMEMAQIALQASAQVINQLRQVSLLDYLR